MDEQNQNQENISEEQIEKPVEPEKKQTGSIIGSIIVIIVIIIGGLYFWGASSSTPEIEIDMPQNKTTEEGVPVADPIGDALRNASNSDDLDAIETDLNATNIDTIDAGVDQI